MLLSGFFCSFVYCLLFDVAKIDLISNLSNNKSNYI
nr:MAG TPA: hypothetical protein [Caudoviricetes sp.]